MSAWPLGDRHKPLLTANELARRFLAGPITTDRAAELAPFLFTQATYTALLAALPAGATRTLVQGVIDALANPPAVVTADVLADAIAPLATQAHVDTQVAAAIAPLATSDAMTAAIADAVAPLATTTALNQVQSNLNEAVSLINEALSVIQATLTGKADSTELAQEVADRQAAISALDSAKENRSDLGGDVEALGGHVTVDGHNYGVEY